MRPILTTRSLGVSHPVLPCGAKILIRYGGGTFLTEVIDNQLKETGRQFELTPSLARLVGLDGTQAIEWRYAHPVATGRAPTTLWVLGAARGLGLST